jgi:hypothetical protein
VLNSPRDELDARTNDRPMTLLASPLLALGFGIFLALAETCRRWGNWPFLPFLLDDWIAGLLLTGWVPHGALLGIVGVLFALAVAGLISTLVTARR